nr:phage/plasmid primase, P4 family [uncultured Oscillibacter sp.]
MSEKKHGYQEKALEEMGFYEDMRRIEKAKKDLHERLKFSNIPELNDASEDESDDGYTWTEDELEDECPNSGSGDEIVKNLILAEKCTMPSNKKAYILSNLARQLIYSLNIRVLNEQKLLEYDPATGCYIDIRDLCQRITATLPEEVICNLRMREIQEIADLIRISAVEGVQVSTDQFNSNDSLINSENGVIDLDNQSLLPYSPSYYFTYCIHARLIKSDLDIHCPNFERFCQTSLDGNPEKRRLLLEMIGYCCCDSNSGKCALFLKGEADSGKSVMLEFISKLFDRSLVTNIPLHELSSPFNRAELFGKKLNIAGEIKGKALSDITTYKSLTGGDRISGERKGKDPFYFETKARLVFAGNTLPGTTEADATAAFTNRMVVLLFFRSISKEQQDKNLGTKLWEERDSIFSLAVKALRQLRERNYIFTMPEESRAYIRAFGMKENSVQTFVNECCELGPDLRVFNADLLEAYKEYCKVNGLVEFSKGRFYEMLDGRPGVYAKRVRIGNENRHGRVGIALKK